MSETVDSKKQAVKHQVGAMYKAIIAQKKVVKHLRSLYYQGSTEQQIQNKVLDARKELVDPVKYLEVAFSIILKAVTESKKRKAAAKGKEGEEKKKKPDNNNNNSSPYTWRSSSYQQPALLYWPPVPSSAQH